MAKLENLFASRFIRARKSNSLLSFLSITSILGVMIGVAALIVVISVMDGFTDNLKMRFLGSNPHIIISNANTTLISDWEKRIEEISAMPQVSGAAPLIMGQAMISNGRFVSGVLVRGVDPMRESDSVRETVRLGSIDELTASSSEAMPTMLVGRELMYSVGALTNKEVTLISTQMARGAFGMVPKMRKFKVAGYFDTGFSQHNEMMIYLNIKEAQDFFGFGNEISAINVSVYNPDDAPKIARSIQEFLNSTRDDSTFLVARDWLSMNTTLFESLKLEEYALFVILTLIIIVASFTIVSMISVTVKDKRKEIAIIRAMGGSEKLISKIFIRQGVIIGFAGTLLGNALALIISFVLMNFKVIEIPAEIYYSDTIPMKLSLSVFIIVTVCALLITFIAALFPAKISAKTSPIEAIRND